MAQLAKPVGMCHVYCASQVTGAQIPLGLPKVPNFASAT